MLLGKSGALTGVTFQGGTGNYGTVFTLTPPAAERPNGKRTVLHNFSAAEGFPNGDLLRDAAGNLYGTCLDANSPPNAARSSASLRPPMARPNGPKNILYVFAGAGDGNGPNGGLVGDGTAVYGTTRGGGASNLGTVFQLAPPDSGDGPWTKTTLYNFTDRTARHRMRVSSKRTTHCSARHLQAHSQLRHGLRTQTAPARPHRLARIGGLQFFRRRWPAALHRAD